MISLCYWMNNTTKLYFYCGVFKTKNNENMISMCYLINNTSQIFVEQWGENKIIQKNHDSIVLFGGGIKLTMKL